MKKFILSAVAILATLSVNAQSNEQTSTENKDIKVEVKESKASTGDLYKGMTKAIPQGRIVLPYGLEVAYDKTTHIIFPSAIRYVDLGSPNIIAGKAEDVENVLRLKASVRDFETETNLSVVCEDGSYYVFNVKYADEPEKLSFEMQDFLQSNQGRLPSNRADIYFKELGSESPILVNLIMKTIHKNDDRIMRNVGIKKFSMKFLLRGLYAHNGLFYFHLTMKNKSNVSYPVDFVQFKVVDKKVTKRTAIQEQVLQPLREYNMPTSIEGHNIVQSVLCLEQFTIPDNKRLEVTLYEKNGARTMTFHIENEDLIRAKSINNLKLNF